MLKVGRSGHWIDASEVGQVAEWVDLGDTIEVGIVNDYEPILVLFLDRLLLLRLLSLLSVLDSLEILCRHDNLGLFLLPQTFAPRGLIHLNSGELGSVLELGDLHQTC